MSSAKRGRVKKSESMSTPSILGFVTGKEPSANEVVNSFIDELLSSVVARTEKCAAKHRGDTVSEKQL